MSETIPDAILAEARAAFGAPWGEEPEDTAAVHRIAQALLDAEKRGAERERARCLAIVEDHDGKPCQLDDDHEYADWFDAGQVDASTSIASAIRRKGAS